MFLSHVEHLQFQLCLSGLAPYRNGFKEIDHFSLIDCITSVSRNTKVEVRIHILKIDLS